jgi:hypothetical protein
MTPRDQPDRPKIKIGSQERSALRFRDLEEPADLPWMKKSAPAKKPGVWRRLPKPSFSRQADSQPTPQPAPARPATPVRPLAGRPASAYRSVPPAAIRPRQAATPSSTARRPADKAIDIKISLPSIKNLRQKLPRVSRKNLLRTGIALGVIIALLAGWRLIGRPHQAVATKPKNTKPQPTAVAPAELPRETPKFATVLPEGKDINALGGWTRVSPPSSDPVYAYVDKIGSVQINVSEQPLPEDFKDDTANKVAEVAKNFNATDKVTTNLGIIYIGNSVKGPQSVITAHGDLLILIKSVAPLTHDQWAAYISTLK